MIPGVVINRPKIYELMNLVSAALAWNTIFRDIQRCNRVVIIHKQIDDARNKEGLVSVHHVCNPANHKSIMIRRAKMAAFTLTIPERRKNRITYLLKSLDHFEMHEFQGIWIC